MVGPNILKRLAAIPDNQKRRPNVILAVVCLSMVLDLSNLSAVTIALPTIGQEFHVEQAQLQWVISAYALTYGSFLLLGGRSGDIFGHRRVLLFGLCFFALFTLLCALAPSFIVLVVARAFQGIGAGFTIPSAQAHVAIYFPEPREKAKALGFWSAAGSVGFITGLILGGVLTALLGWRWIFWISLIVAGLMLPAAYFVLPRAAGDDAQVAGTQRDDDSTLQEGDVETAHPEEGSSEKRSIFASIKARCVRFDVLGVCLGVPGLLLLTYALTTANISGWGSPSIVSTLVVAFVILALFVVREAKASQPLINPKLFHSLSFNLTLVLAICLYAVRQACSYFLTLQLQSYGSSALHTAVLFLPVGVTALIINSFAGRLVPLLGARVMFIIGWSLTIPGVILFSFISPEKSYWKATFPGMVLYIAGLSVSFITANFVVVSSASKADQGVAASVFNMALQVGGSVFGLAVLTAVADGINGRFGSHRINDDTGTEMLSLVGYKSVYYSCTILSGLALCLSLFAIKVPESMKGSIWNKQVEENSYEKDTEASTSTTTGDEGLTGSIPTDCESRRETLRPSCDSQRQRDDEKSPSR